MHKNFNMMKRYAIPLVKTFGSAALSNVRMNLSASHTRMLFSMAMLVMMMLAPSSVMGVTTTMDFGIAGIAHNHQYSNPSLGNYLSAFNMSSTDYSAIGNGAKVGDNIVYKYGRTTTLDISRLAFVFNADGKGNENNTGAGFYLRRDGGLSGLYTGSSGNKIAVLGLAPGDKVTFAIAGTGAAIKYVQSVHADEGNGDLWNYAGVSLTNTITILSPGDLIVEANQGTYISSITIAEEIAEYEILTNSDNSTEFWFTAPGSLEVNDFAIPYMSVSFGSASDYLVVQGSNENDCAAHMFQTTGQYAGTETLSTDASTNWQPSAGNFYAFRPTGGGTVQVSGSLTGSKTHLFVYDPAKNNGNGGWEGDWPTFYSDTYTSGSFSFNVEKDKIYYICIDNGENSGEHSNAFHLHWFKFTPTFRLDELAKVVDLDNDVENGSIKLTKIYGYGNSTNITVKRCTANIDETTVNARIVSNNDGSGYLTIDKPTFASGTDEAGTIILDVETGGGDATFVVTFPYHADFRPAGYTDPNRSYGHTWNFINPLLSDSNIGNCKKGDGTVADETTGILSIGQDKDTSSQLHIETENREWTRDKRVTGSAGGYHDPMFKNVYDMEGDNADMIWETEGLWFDTGSNLSCLYNESDAYDVSLCNPLDYPKLGTDPDRYVGLLPDADGASSFTIPGLKDGDRVLIFMKSGEATSTNGIFLNIHGALDAVGTEINESDLYKAGGTNFIKDANHQKYEGCYHFIKKGDGPMKFDLVGGSMCKLLYIRIYSGKRIDTNDIVSGGKLLLANDKGATVGDQVTVSKHYSGKGQHSNFKVLCYSGSLNDDSFNDNNFVISGTYNNFLTIKSTVGEMGIFRVRMTDLTYEYAKSENEKITYVADFCDRNFTVGYRDKVVYPYTWDFTDVNTYSGGKITTEANKYVETNNKYENTGWDISLFDNDGNMKVSTGVDPDNENEIFSADKAGYGNQLWADDGVIAETRGLWFYTDDNNPQYNDCMQITAEGIRFANTKVGSHTPNWNYKMVVPSVPKDGAVYVRMKRDSNVKDDDVLNGTPFLATKFHFGVATADEKTSVSTGTEVINGNGHSSSKYSFYKVPDTDDEYILAVLNTGAAGNLTFTLNGWMVEKVAVSTDPKKVNKLGWATESRARVIDPELTSYLTGREFKTYIVTSADHASKTVTLAEVEAAKKVMPISENGDANAYIIRNMNLDTDPNNKEPGRVKILNDGFHLFVPDMHDYVANRQGNLKLLQDMTSSLMKSQLTEGTVKQKGDGENVYNYVLTTEIANLGTEGQILSEQSLNYVGFFRAQKSGVSSSGNQGYLPLMVSGTTNAKYSFVFIKDWEVPTAIEVPSEKLPSGIESVEGNASYYNMNGQRLNGRPSKSGIYIVNGKKVILK